MGGHSKKAGKGGGGGGSRGRYCAPEERTKLHKDPGVPGADLRRAGQALTRTKAGGQRNVLNIPTLQHKKRSFGGFSSAVTGEVSDEQRMSEMAAMALQAAQKQAEFQAPNALLGDGGDSDGGNEEDYSRKGKDVSLRRFFKEFQRVVNSSDVLLEVLDIRDPMGCRLLQMEKSIESQWGDKKTVVIVLNKVDLVSPEIVEKWMEYFENDQNMLVIPFTANKDNANRTACIARLFKQLRSIARGEGGARKNITVGLIGYPNVGKSSVINALKRKQVVGVGNTPGFTTGNTEVDLRQDIKIIDCPGVVMPGEDTGDVVLRNAVKVDQLPNPLVAVERLIERCDPSQLSAVYEVGTFTDTVDFVRQVGHRRGRVRQGGVVDEDETARIILHDWNDGRIGYYTLPPTSQFAFKKSTAPGSEEEETTHEGVSVLRTLSTGMQLDVLPTFHLQRVASAGQRKRAKLYDESWNDQEPSEASEESSDEEIDDEPPKFRRRR